MSIAMPTVSTSAQSLIDARLDVIERILMDRMNRQDRLTIVREVESQIHELLAERGVDEASREDVLAVLARLDPPEAYLSDEVEGLTVSSGPTGNARPVSPAVKPPKALSVLDFLSISSGILGIVAGAAGFLMSVIALMIVEGVDFKVPILPELIVYGGLSVSLLTSPSSLALAFYSRFQSRWAVIGLTCSLFSMIAAIVCVWFALTA